MASTTVQSNTSTELAARAAIPEQREATLALCIVAHNQADELQGCVEQLRPCLDEIIVVDLESSDNTTDAANDLGALVLHQDRDCDRSRAMNAAIRRATADWLLCLDPGDRLAFRELRPLTRNLDDRNPEAWSFRCSYGKPGSGTHNRPTGTLVSRELRLFPNVDSVAFTGRVHQSVEPSLRRLGIGVRDSGITIRCSVRRDPIGDRELSDINHPESLDDEYAMLCLGRRYARRGEFKRAADIFSFIVYNTRTREMEPTVFRHAFLNLAEALDAGGHHEAALQEYDRLIALAPDFPLARLARGQFKLQHCEDSYCAKVRAAEADFQVAVRNEIKPESFPLNIDGLTSAAWAGLGRCRLMRNDLAGAETAFKGALEACPCDVSARLMLANTLVDRGRFDQARRNYERCIEEDDGFFEAHYNLADCLDRAGRGAQAIATFAEAARLMPRCPDTWLRMGRLHLDRAEEAQAARCFRRAVDIRPDRPGALLACAATLLDLGNCWQALHSAKRALGLPGTPSKLEAKARGIIEEARKRADEQPRTLSLCFLNTCSADHLEELLLPIADDCDEVIVADVTGDSEVEAKCRASGFRFIAFDEYDSCSAVEREATLQSTADWMLRLNADDAITPSRLAAVRELITDEPQACRGAMPFDGAGLTIEGLHLMPNIPGQHGSGPPNFPVSAGAA